MGRSSRFLLPAFLAAMLAACGGGGGGAVDDSAADTPPAASAGGVPQDGGSGGGASSVNNKSLAVRIDPVTDPLLDGLAIAADADTRGMWSGPVDWPLVAIHASLLPDGRLATFGTPLANPSIQAARLFDIWDPLAGTGAGAHNTVLNATDVDSFCSSATWTTSGKLLLSGGNSTLDSVLLDVETQSTLKTPRFASERWYATVLTLADGRPVILGGGDYYYANTFENPQWYDDGLPTDVNDGVAMTPEVYDEGTGWRLLQGATSREAFGPDHNRYFYPRAWVAPDGKVFGLSSDKYWRMDPLAAGGDGGIEILGTFHAGISETELPNMGPTSSAVMFAEGRILQTGGNGYTNGANSASDVTYTHRTTSSARATVFDLGDGSVPVITDVAPMNHARQWHNVTVLADGQVLANGGTRYANYGGTDAVKVAEIWNPATDTWTEMAAAQRVRVYHNTSLLMQNGVVFTGGGGVPGPVTNLDAEFFYPPYLFERVNGEVRLAGRVSVLSVSSRQLVHGATLTMQLDSDAPVAEVAMIALGNATHSNNAGQRRLSAAFSQDDFMLEVEMPENGGKTPPGYYMVVVLDAKGVPSRGVTIGLGLALN